MGPGVGLGGPVPTQYSVLIFINRFLISKGYIFLNNGHRHCSLKDMAENKLVLQVNYMCIRYSILSHTFASVSAATAVAMLPTRNHVKLTNLLFLTVHVLIVTVELAAELKHFDSG